MRRELWCGGSEFLLRRPQARTHPRPARPQSRRIECWRRQPRLRVETDAPALSRHADLPQDPPEHLVPDQQRPGNLDRKSTRLNSSHSQISYAVFCLKKKKKKKKDK